MIDDVYSGGNKAEGQSEGYPTLSSAMQAGFLHPNCKDSFTTYFPELQGKPDRRFTQEEIDDIGENAKREAKQAHAKKRAEQFDRMARHSLDPENQRKYAARKKEWEITADSVMPDALKKSVAKFDKQSVKKLSRKQLEHYATDIYARKQVGINYDEGVLRAKALMDGNTDAQLRKYIVKY